MVSLTLIIPYIQSFKKKKNTEKHPSSYPLITCTVAGHGEDEKGGGEIKPGGWWGLNLALLK